MKMADVKVGKVIHYYDKISVAVVEVLKLIKVGDELKISGHDNEFTQTVVSMQMEHEILQTAKKGQSVGLKVDQAVKEGDELFLAN